MGLPQEFKHFKISGNMHSTYVINDEVDQYEENICRPKHRLPLTTMFYASEKDRNHVTT
jgi:hypothetical protein